MSTTGVRVKGVPVRAMVVGLGFSSAVTQLVLLRELLGTFQGNEMVLGVLLGNWLLLTGAGAWLGRWVVGGGSAPESAAQSATLESSARSRAPSRGPAPDRPRSRRRQSAPTFSAADSERRVTSAATPFASAEHECGVRVVFQRLPLWLAGLQLWIALIPFVQVLAVRLGRNVLFVRGAALGLDETVWSSLGVLGPYAVASGLFLTLASRCADDHDAARGATGVYLADCVGSVLGGALFTFVLVRWLDHFALLTVPALVNSLLAALAFRHLAGNGAAAPPLVLAAVLIGSVVWLNPDALTTAWQCRPDQVVYRAQSPYGRLVVTKSGGQLNFLENGLPLLSSHQPERAEEAVHFALAQRPEAREVLLISGTFSGAATEVLKYGVTNVTCVELDPAILDAGRRLLPDRLADARVRVVSTDGRRFVQRARARFDVVIVDMPEPATAQVNRYYTAEFFAEVKRVLKPEGVVAFGLSQYDNYISAELGRLLASAAQTLRFAFREVLLLPAGKVWFLGSDGPLTTSIAARLAGASVSTQWMRPSYLDAVLTPDRLATVRSAADAPAPLNTDFRPVLYYLHLRHWLSQFDVWLGTATAILGVLVVVYGVRLSAAGLAVFSAGFAGSSLEVVLLLGVQVLYGSLYQQLGLVITVFMAGLAAGAWLGGRRTERREALAEDDSATPPGPPGNWPPVAGRRRGGPRGLACLALALAAYSLVLPWALAGLGRAGAAGLPPWIGQGVVAVLTGALAMAVGLEFPLACRVERADARSLAARLLTADFVGACVGAVLAGAVLLPVLGVRAACALAAALNALAGALLLWRQRAGSERG